MQLSLELSQSRDKRDICKHRLPRYKGLVLFRAIDLFQLEKVNPHIPTVEEEGMMSAF
jgi:hypothetical protein